MKIIFITREGYNLPGARVRCYNFAKELTRHNIDTEVLSFSDTLGAKDGAKESLMSLKDKIRFNYKAFNAVARNSEAVLYLQRFNYHSFAPYLAHLFNKNRIILDLDDWEIRDNPTYYFGLYPSSKAHYFTRSIAKRSVFCIAASRFLEEFLLTFNKKVYYIPSGVDTELFKPSFNGSIKDKIVFSWIGTFHKKEYIENIELALSCFGLLRKRYPHIYFEIVGDGIYKDSLVKLISQYSDKNILLKGWIEPDRIPEYLAGIHVGIMPVLRENKFNSAKSPTKLFEYMAMAKPTVSSCIGEPVHIISEGNDGFLAETKEEFAEKMQKLIEDSELRRLMGEKARQTIEKDYSLKVLGKRLHEIVKTI